MSKRTRGSRRAQRRAGRGGSRPGRRDQRGVSHRQYAASDLAVAPEIAEELLEEEGDREVAVERPATSVAPRSRARPSSLLATKAATEYVYVAQDVRRIVAVALALFAVMFALWILIVVAKVIAV
jgi:uncharacterized membrane protein